MKLKTRITISFFIIILVPICLAGVAFVGFSKFKIKSIQEQYGIEGVAYDTLSSNLTLLNKMTQRIYDSIWQEAQRNPEAFTDKAYLKELNGKLVNQYSYLVARREKQVYFCGSSIEAVPQGELPAYGDSRVGSDSGIFMGEETHAFVKQIDFVFNNGDKGSIFIVTNADTVVPR